MLTRAGASYPPWRGCVTELFLNRQVFIVRSALLMERLKAPGSWTHLRSDAVAGVSVALVLVPQSLAYAQLAGLPPARGLYAAAVPPIAAAPLGSSPYLQPGPTA